jgi:hypothetical protein
LTSSCNFDSCGQCDCEDIEAAIHCRHCYHCMGCSSAVSRVVEYVTSRQTEANTGAMGGRDCADDRATKEDDRNEHKTGEENRPHWCTCTSESSSVPSFSPISISIDPLDDECQATAEEPGDRVENDTDYQFKLYTPSGSPSQKWILKLRSNSTRSEVRIKKTVGFLHIEWSRTLMPNRCLSVVSTGT